METKKKKPSAEIVTFVDTGMDSLTPKQRAFVNALMENEEMSINEAAHSVGYQHSYQLLKNPKVKLEVQKLMDERNARCAMNADKLLTRIVKVLEVCTQEVPYTNMQGEGVMGKDGKPVIDMVDKRGAIAAATLIGKHVDVQAWREPEQNINVTRNQGLDLSKLSFEEQENLMHLILKTKALDREESRMIESKVVSNG